MSRRGILLAALFLCPALCSSGWQKSPARFNRAPVIIDPGHGGRDLGAVVRGYYEKDLNLAVAHRLKRILQERYSVPARLTRRTDDFIPLNERIDRSIAWNGALFVSLHADKVRFKKANGIAVYSFKKQRRRKSTGRTRRKGLPRLGAPSRYQQRRGAALARSLTKAFKTRKLNVDPAQTQDYYVLKNPEIPSVLIEMGYLSNAKEYKLLRTAAYQEKLAETIAATMVRYLDRTSPMPAPPPFTRSPSVLQRVATPLQKTGPAL